MKNMEVLTLKRLQQYHTPHPDEASEVKDGRPINLAYIQHAGSHQIGSILSKSYMNPCSVALPLEGRFLSEYFGLAMAICAVGLLRSACSGSEASNNRFSREATQNRARAGIPLEPLVQYTCLICQGKEKQEKVPSNQDEQSRIFQKLRYLQMELLELKRLRSEDGKANERVVSMFAGKEQEWKVERRKLREELHKLYQQLQTAFLQQEALRMELEQMRSLQKQPCSECEHKEGLLSQLKERLGEQEFLIMATMEEVQIERQEKNAVAEKLAAVELCVSQLQDKLSMEAECHALELTKREELLQLLESRAKRAESDNSQILQELAASQDSLSDLMHDKSHCKELISDMSREIEQLQITVKGKDDIIANLFKKAKADAEDRKELENELAFMEVKLQDAEREKQKWRKHVQMYARPSCKDGTSKPRSILESQLVPVAGDTIEGLQKLHDDEILSLQSVSKEQVQMLRKRLGLYQERVTDLEEDILLRMTDAKHMMRHGEQPGPTRGNSVDNKGLLALHECIKTELAALQFQLSVARTSIKQFMESEAYREQEIERWKKLYFASKVTIGVKTENERHTGAMVPRSPKLQNWLELEKSRLTSKLEQRHWQEIEGFERHMKARDERMEAFRWQLLHMEDEVQRAHCHVETLKQSLEAVHVERRRLEEILKQKEDELLAYQNKALLSYNTTNDKKHEGEVRSLQEKVAMLQAMLTEREVEFEISFAKASSQAEYELHATECKLAVAEAQLVQAHIIREGERKEKENLFFELQKQKADSEHC